MNFSSFSFFLPDSRSCRRCSHSSHPGNQASISIQLNKERMEILWIKLKENQWRVENYFKQTSRAAWENALCLEWFRNFRFVSFLNLDMSEWNRGGKKRSSGNVKSHLFFFLLLLTNYQLVDLNKIQIQVLLLLKSSTAEKLK